MSSNVASTSQNRARPVASWCLLNGYHWYVFILAAFGWLFDCFDQQIFTMSRSITMRDLMPAATTLEQIKFGGWATSIFIIGWATGGLIFGVLGDKWGRAKTTALTIFVYALCTGLSGFTNSWETFAAFRFMTGAGVGGEFAVGAALVTEVKPDLARPFALGGLQALSTVGNILAAVSLGVVVPAGNLGWGWRGLYYIGALPALVAVFVFWRLREPDRWVAATIVALLIAGITASAWLALLATRARNNEARANQKLKQQVAETEHARRDTATALERMQIQKAEDLFGTGQASVGVAYLGQVLRANPSNDVAASRLASALVHRRFSVPITEPLRDERALMFAQFSPDGQRVATASQDKTARVWEAHTGQPITPPLRHEGVVRSVRFSPDGHRLVTASLDGRGRVWDAQFSPDGQRVVTASVDKTARVWDAHTGRPLSEPLRHEDAVGSAQFSPDGQRVVTASLDKTAHLGRAHRSAGERTASPYRSGRLGDLRAIQSRWPADRDGVGESGAGVEGARRPAPRPDVVYRMG